MIELNQVSKSFGSKEVVKNLSFWVEKKEILVLLGTSGCGKTTTLKMINRLVEPTQGTIRINGKNILDEKPEYLRRNIGYVIQDIGLFPHYTVLQNIGIVPQLLKWNNKDIEKRCDELLQLLDLPLATKNSYPHELSGGQKQRVGIARAIAADPPVVLLDEPFGALDPVTRQQIQAEFGKLETLQDKTMVLVTHDVFEAVMLGNRICLMDKGEIQQIGTARELVFTPKNDFVKKFFDGQRFQLELHVVTLMDLLQDSSELEETNEAEIVDNEKIRLPLKTNLLTALEALENTESPKALIEIITPEKKNKYLDRQQLLSLFYKVKEQWANT